MTARCPECGGSGKRAGIYADLICPDCDGEGSWIDELEEGDTGKTLDQVIAESPELRRYRDELRARLWGVETRGDPLLGRAA